MMQCWKMAHSCVVHSPALLLVLEVYTEDIVGVVAWSWRLHALTISKRSKLRVNCPIDPLLANCEF